jgi:hypothetical protein
VPNADDVEKAPPPPVDEDDGIANGSNEAADGLDALLVVWKPAPPPEDNEGVDPKRSSIPDDTVGAFCL